MTTRQKQLIENYIRLRVRKSLNESSQIDLWEKIEAPLTQLRTAIADLRNSTSNPKWKAVFQSLENDLDKFEEKSGNASRKLGVVPLN